MERRFLIAAIIWAIISAIGFAMLILTSSPTWLQLLSLGVGIIGAMGSWTSLMVGAAYSLQARMLGLQTRMLEPLEEIRDRLVK